jgi:hypothetical protein
MDAALAEESVIAEREVEFEPSTSEGPRETVRFRLGRPVEDAHEWSCPFEVLGFGERRSGEARGADSVQALLLALAKIRIVLGTLALEQGGRLRFAGRSGPGLPSLLEDPA